MTFHLQICRHVARSAILVSLVYNPVSPTTDDFEWYDALKSVHHTKIVSSGSHPILTFVFDESAEFLSPLSCDYHPYFWFIKNVTQQLYKLNKLYL